MRNPGSDRTLIQTNRELSDSLPLLREFELIGGLIAERALRREGMAASGKLLNNPLGSGVGERSGREKRAGGLAAQVAVAKS